LCPIIGYQLRGALFLAKVPHGPQTKILISSESKKMKPYMNFLFPVKVPVNEPPLPHLLQQGPYEESCPFNGLFTYILNSSQ